METIKELNRMSEIPEKELASIIKQGAMLRIPYLEGRLAQAKENIKLYEKKYNTKLKQLQNKGLPENTGFEMHEDFIEWEYWHDVVQENEKIVRKLKRLIEEMGEN